MLLNRGYLEHYPQLPDELEDDRYEPPDELEDRYAPTQKLVNRMIESRRKAEERRKAKEPPTH
jgi:hypothetical protein